MNGFSFIDLRLLLPELLLAGTVLILFAGDTLLPDPVHKRRYLTLLALLGLLASAAAALDLSALMLDYGRPLTAIFTGQVAVDPIAMLFKVLFAAITVVGVLTSLLSDELPDKHMGEYYALLLSICFGMFLMASANDLLMVYLALELVSIVSFAMAGYRMHDKRSSEAALKYVIYGGAASGAMLFGMSLLYGMVGTTELTAINHGLVTLSGAPLVAAGIPERVFPLMMVVAVTLVFVGIGYKIAVVPFHMWSPDVYEGSPTPFTGFLSVGPKAAGFALLLRFFIGTLIPGSGGPGYDLDVRGVMPMAVDMPLPAVIGIIAAATMTVGNLAAIPQNNVKRMLAYSSIAHAGYLLMGFVVLSPSALHAVAFYLVIYFVMNIGAFTVVQAVRDRTGGEELHDFRGLGQRAPLLAIAMVIFLLSLTGLPPLAGFIGKFYLFAAVVKRNELWYWVLAMIAVVNSAVSLYYYMRVARAMFLTEPVKDEPLNVGLGYHVVTTALAVPVLVLGLYWAPLSRSITRSLSFYRAPAVVSPVAATTTPAPAPAAVPSPSLAPAGARH
ncbi:MAG: NADH-quinone oxidoreductase subunit N [Deltaproteobacteria bacterium]|nr:NADH-quinone oxidoreductase subunit N [Deltaproteobacteria bacterium]